MRLRGDTWHTRHSPTRILTGVVDGTLFRIVLHLRFPVDAAGPDHAAGAEVDRFPPTQDAGYREATLELATFVATRLGDHWK